MHANALLDIKFHLFAVIIKIMYNDYKSWHKLIFRSNLMSYISFYILCYKEPQ